jgi:hypothetical protein
MLLPGIAHGLTGGKLAPVVFTAGQSTTSGGVTVRGISTIILGEITSTFGSITSASDFVLSGRSLLQAYNNASGGGLTLTLSGTVNFSTTLSFTLNGVTFTPADVSFAGAAGGVYQVTYSKASNLANGVSYTLTVL